MTFERKLPIILLIVFFVLTAAGFIFYQNTVSVKQALDWEKHTQDVSVCLDATLAAALDMESGVRGFVLVGSDTYLEPYNRGKTRLAENVSKLRSLTAGNEVQQAEVEKLAQVGSGLQQELQSRVDRRKVEGPDAAFAILGEMPVKQRMDGIRASIDNIQNDELSSLRRREEELNDSLVRTVWIFIIGCSIGIIALVLANVLTLRETGRRRLAEMALREANRGLEQKVETRTRELTEANLDLQQLLEERDGLLVREKSAREEAEVATRLRDEFMATVSHELRTPINSILGWSRMMRDGRLDAARQSKAVETIIKNSETQNRLIADLMDVARVISGKLELEKTEVDPFELAATAVESIKPQAEAKGLSLTYQKEGEGAGKMVSGDHDRLMQVLSNLLTNAVKFTPQGGHVRISASADNGSVVYKVSDDGVGISPEFLPLVFERFRQDVSAARNDSGLGLGLAIVRQLVELHGGTVQVDSRGRGYGSTFTVELPTA